jgi:hypothetical protein
MKLILKKAKTETLPNPETLLNFQNSAKFPELGCSERSVPTKKNKKER